MEYQNHPAADCFPMMDDETFAAHLRSIKSLGQQEFVKLYDGMILDGRNRMKACAQLGIEPLIEEVRTDDPVGYVIAANLARRHLTTKQRAAIAAELATLEIGSNPGKGHIVTPEGAQNCAPSMSVKQAAEAMQVSPRSVTTAKKTMREDPKAHEDAKAGVKPKRAPRKVPDTRGWKDAVMELLPKHLNISRERLQRREDRGGLRSRIEAKLGYAIPQRVTDEQAAEIARIAEIVCPITPADRERMEAEKEELLPSLPENMQRRYFRLEKNLERNMENRIEEEIKLRLEETILPRYRENAEKYRRLINAKGNTMDRTDYKRLLSVLHPDREPDPEKRAAMFDLIKGLELELCGDEKENDLLSTIPATAAELMARRKVRS